MTNQSGPNDERFGPSSEDETIRRAQAEAQDRIEPRAAGTFSLPASLTEPGDVVATSILIEGFTLHRHLGSGGAASVFEASQHDPPRQVAIKVLRPHMSSEELIRRFQFEARLLARLNHSGIVTVFEYGTSDFGGHLTPFIAMELVHGQPVNRYCQQAGVGWREKICLLIAICDAVQHAHQKGIVHRDLKPANVLVDNSGNPHVLDFGVASLIKQPVDESTMHTQTGQWLGTLPYMSPEQLSVEGHDIDTRSDVYALGVMAYEVFAGVPPFRSDLAAPVSIVDRICKEPAPMLGKISPECRGDLETIVGKAIQKNPDDRYPTVAELAADLTRTLNGEPILARRTPVFGRIYRWCKRQRAVASLTACLLLAFLLLLISLFQSWRATRAYAEQRRVRLYAAEMNLAFQAMQVDDIGTVRRLLSRQIPGPDESDQRNFEWRYLWGLVNSSERVLRAHGAPVHGITFSPNGRWLASVGLEEWIIWDTATWNPVARRKHPGTAILALAFSPNSELLAIGYRQNRCQVIRVADGEVQHEFKDPLQIYALGFSPDGKMLAVGSGTFDDNFPQSHPGSLSLIELESGQIAWKSTMPIFSVTSLRFFDSGRKLLTGHGTHPVRLWDLEKILAGGDDTTVVGLEIAAEIAATSTDIAVNTDETLLAIGAIKGDSTLWNLVEQSAGPKIPIDQIAAVEFSPDSSKLLTVSRRGYPAQIWDISSGRLLDELYGHEGDVLTADYFEDGTIIATAGEDRSIRLWDAGKQHSQQTIPVGEKEIAAMVISRDERWLATGDRSGSTRIWDTQSWECIYHFADPGGLVESVELSPDGQILVVAARSGLEHSAVKAIHWRQQAAEYEVAWESDLINCLAYSACGRFLACATIEVSGRKRNSAAIRVWGTDDWQLLWQSEMAIPSAQSIAFSRDSAVLCSGHVDGRVRCWDASKGKLLCQSEQCKGFVTEVKYSHDGTKLGVGTWPHWDLGEPGPEVRILDGSTLDTIHVLQGHKGGVYGVGFSADDETLASGGGGGLVKLWDVANGLQRAEFNAPATGWVFNAQFSSDGSRLYATYGSSTDDSGIVVWNAPPFDEIKLQE